MAITRSQIARQLLAEGGAPRRARFANGSFPREGYGIGTYNIDKTLIQTGYAPDGSAEFHYPFEAAAMGIFPIRKEDQDLISLTGSGLANQAAIRKSQRAAQAEAASDIFKKSMGPTTQTTPTQTQTTIPTGGIEVLGGRIVPSVQDPGSGKFDLIDASGVPTAISKDQVEMMLSTRGATPTPQFSDPRMQAAADKGIDARMGRTLEENIKALADPRMTKKRSSGFFGALRNRMTPVLDPVPTNDPFKSNLGAPMTGRDPLTGMPESEMLPGIPGVRSISKEDDIRKRVLEAQMNQSGRTFTEGKYANEAEAIADLGIERYNQLFSKGGEVSLDDAKENAPPGEFLAYINPKEADMLRAAGGSGIMTAMGIPSFFDDTSYGEDMGASYSSSPSGGGSGFSGGDDGFGGGDEFARPTYAQQLINIQRGDGDPPPMITADPDKFIKTPAPGPIRSFFNRVITPVRDTGQRLSINYIRNELDRRKNYDQSIPGKLGFKLDTTPFDSRYATRTEELEDALTRAIVGEDVTATIQRGRTFGTEPDTRGDNEFIPTLFRQNLVPEPTEPEKTGIEKVLADADEFRFLLPERFKLEDGGIVPRQAYGLGSIVSAVTRPVKKVVKKTARAVKKIAKSDLGKLALAAATIYFAPQLAGRLPAAKNPMSFLGQLQSGNRMAALKTLLPGGTDPFTGETSGISKLIQSLGSKTSVAGGIDADVNQALAKTAGKEVAKSSLFRDLALIGGPSILAGALAKEDIGDEDLDSVIAASREDKSGLPELLAEFDDFRFVVPEEYRQSAAEGGMMSLGGMEMDLRGGGFVPIGREEKADDVPARLSKNEFVFTADAVRAAGGGSVDKGADLMYKTMKQLENKVA